MLGLIHQRAYFWTDWNIWLSTSVLSYLGTILFVTWQVQYDQLGMGGGQEGGEFVS